jgi:hypothetical protein
MCRATSAIVTRRPPVWPGRLLADVLAMFVGNTFAAKIPMKLVHFIVSVSFCPLQPPAGCIELLHQLRHIRNSQPRRVCRRVHEVRHGSCETAGTGIECHHSRTHHACHTHGNGRSIPFAAHHSICSITHHGCDHSRRIRHIQRFGEHAELMKKFPSMEHEEPNMASVQPGQTGHVIWQFTKSGKVPFACLQSGHFDAGMKGMVSVDASKAK